MMFGERLTKKNSPYECKIAECYADDWVKEFRYHNSEDSPCDDCPFMKYINKLAKLEDYIENNYDDGK